MSADAKHMVTVTFDANDVIDIIKALRAVIDADKLRIIAHAELAR